MPMPLSLTEISTCDSARCSTTWTRPPLGVNLIAFEIRFHITCWSRSESPEIMPARSSSTSCSRICLASLAGTCDSAAALITGSRSIGRTSSRNLPETTRDTSTRSSMSCACDMTLRSMTSSARWVFASSSVPLRSNCVQVRMGASGLRSSCETVARNSSFR